MHAINFVAPAVLIIIFFSSPSATYATYTGVGGGGWRAAAHGANKLDFLVYTACTRVQTVPLDPYSCTGEMTPSIQVYTPDESTRTAVHPASLQMYSC